MPPPDVFLTGGTGFIGGAVLRHLVATGRSVRALARTSDTAAGMRDAGVEPVRGDLESPDTLRDGMDGCRVVFHVAGLNGMCLADPRALERVNVEGTRNLVRAAADAGVNRIVYTSSAAAIGEAAGTVGTEESPHRGSYNSAYERSKHRAEQAAFEDAASLGIELVAVNPSSVQGPGRTGGTARILIGYLRGRLRVAVDAAMSLAFIDDVVEAHLVAETKGRAGKRYLVSGWTTSVGEAIESIREVTGTDRQVRMIPAWALHLGSYTVGGIYRLLRRDAPVCPEMVRSLRHGHRYDGSRVEREWGFSYTPPQVWLNETVEWYRRQGIVP